MYYAHAWYDKHCRWCQKAYHAHKPVDRDGFCCGKCKQAHYRAYKKYVTGFSAGVATGSTRRRRVK